MLCSHARAASPLKYSVLRSTAPRFAEARTQSVPFGVYNQDCAHKKTLESVSRGGCLLERPFDLHTIRYSRAHCLTHTVAVYGSALA